MHTITIYFILFQINKPRLVWHLLHSINYHSLTETSKTTFSSWCICKLIFKKKSRLQIGQKRKENLDLLKENLKTRSSDKQIIPGLIKPIIYTYTHTYILININICYIHTRICTHVLSQVWEYTLHHQAHYNMTLMKAFTDSNFQSLEMQINVGTLD